jgi:hypothetical protein
MELIMKKRLCFIALLTLLGSTALGSEYNGFIEGDGLRLSSSDGSPARVSLYVAQKTACSTYGWYAYENAAAGIGSLWTAALIEAKINKHRITAVGNGTCDQYGIERISYIDLTSTVKPSVPGNGGSAGSGGSGGPRPSCPVGKHLCPDGQCITSSQSCP